ncbi:hypothetical protein [Kibdelosporangium phytohabitans]|uniref:Uncharacterized protein n=1 Tax=Kibdelosporangium phytohabitans TaxID=860235 RepID=A0A0N7F4V4_9PSEU|nr:hypothetical protein [Kibdelosporangium phytohabitans]ALG12479.1 hypothetical protein AOZ06_41465 [Kibdelosporangium phytohabitans]MBE1464073.1 hypothetical protein [Kibdelosporangium phytohabitans]
MQRHLTVPYVTAWSAEQDLSGELIYHSSGRIGYADETAMDRDAHGILWVRAESRPGESRPDFGEVNSLRQRRAMRRLLCQVCGGPADRNIDGVLWLLPDFREDWPGWPDAMANAEPPICARCVRLSVRLCPKLRRGAAVIRVRECPVAGVRGKLYMRDKGEIVPVKNDAFAFDDPMIRWVQAYGLVRQLRGCTLLAPGELPECDS